MAEGAMRIRILAQPDAARRERYSSELDSQHKRALRFIRTGTISTNFDYPTIEIPKYLNSNKRLYIRITPTTVQSEQVPVTCVHPYPIDTPTADVIRDIEKNTLFFPITDEDFAIGHKSFRITRKKLVQYDLKNYGPLRLLNSNEYDIIRVQDPTNARRFINVYQLGKSHLVFSLAELVPSNRFPVIYEATSTYSIIMVESNPPPLNSMDRQPSVICVPNRSNWLGNQDVLMVLTKLDRRKSPKIMFDHPSMNNLSEIKFEYVDTKTILFTTPAYPIPFEKFETIEVPLVVKQGSDEIARVKFYYELSNECLTCSANSIFDSSDDSENLILSTSENHHMEDDIFDN